MEIYYLSSITATQQRAPLQLQVSEELGEPEALELDPDPVEDWALLKGAMLRLSCYAIFFVVLYYSMLYSISTLLYSALLYCIVLHSIPCHSTLLY